MNPLGLIILLVAMVFGGIAAYNAYVMNAAEKAKLALYNNQIERYLKKSSISKNRIPAKGNVIFVDAKTKKIDELSDYPRTVNNSSKDPSDVNSVVLHNCEYVKVGSYTNGSNALQQICDFTVIDIASGTWSNWGKFKGAMPPEQIKRKRGGTSDERGERAVYSFLEAGGVRK